MIESSSATIDGVVTNGDMQPERSEIAEKAATIVESLGRIVRTEESSYGKYSEDKSSIDCNYAPEVVSICRSKRSYREGTLSINEEMLCNDRVPEERKIEIRAGIIPMLVYSITEYVGERFGGSKRNILLRLYTNKIEQYCPGRWEESLGRIYQRVTKN